MVATRERLSKKGSRYVGTSSDIQRAFVAGRVLVIMVMSSCCHNRRRLARASLSVLSLSIVVSNLLSLSSTAAAGAAAAAKGPTYESERNALQSMYADAWLNWNKTGADPCRDAWKGITCDGGARRQHVIAINLSGTAGIDPPLFFPKLGSLPKLNSLSLANCGLTGNLSSVSGNLSFLSLLRSLDLSRNTLKGEIPSMFGNLMSLQSVSLAHNQLDGQVPTDVCQAKSMAIVRLEGNHLVDSIPSCLGNLTRLAILNISDNRLTGYIPESLGQLKALTELDLAVNSLTGPLPASLTELSKLTKLHLSGNSLNGELPVDFYRMNKLQELYLDSNHFNGPIPVSICGLQSLQKLRLFDNRLTGSIPQDIGNLTKLTILFLNVNQLSGPLPMSLGKLKLLQELQLQGNQFNGTLPGSILTGLTNLRSLYVHFNELEGEIPMQILFLTLLTNVSLGFNKFTGSLLDPQNSPGIPSQSAANLQFLSVCNNSLIGPVPVDMGKLGNLKFLDLSNNELNGSIPSELTSMINSQRVQANLIFNKFEWSSSSTVQGSGACLMLNATLNPECRASGFSKGLAINVGGSNFTSGTGVTFVADNSFTSLLGSYRYSSQNSSDMGASVTPWVVSEQGVVQESSSSIITSSSGPPTPGPLDSLPPPDWNLFQTARVGGDTLSYTIGALTPGDYVINLFFAEIDTSTPPVSRSGQRVFSVYIQQELKYPSLDIFNMTGGPMKPLILSFPISIAHGVIDVRLVGRGSWPATQEQMMVYYGPLLSALSIQPVKKSNHWIVIVASVGGGSLLGLAGLSACVSCVLWRRVWRRRKRAHVCTWNNVGLLPFKYAELEAATSKFSQVNLLGQGAFGKVFKGVLPDGAVIAIKLLSIPNPTSLECLQNELQVISTARHRNLVSLIGCCLELECPVLVCEYMPNGNLHEALFKESSPVFLSWSARCKIALDIGRGLHYLHNESVHRIVHRDVKPANILLDSKLSAHIADFGMARLLADQEIEIFTGVMGTRGYMAPEYALHGQLSDKVDVFSFGVVLLELVIGRRGMQPAISSPDPVPLCHWAWQMFTAGQFDEMVDKRLGTDHVFSEVISMLKIAIWCTEYCQSLRPSMSQVLLMLTNQAAVPPLPQHRKGYGEELLNYSRPFEGDRWGLYSSSYGDLGPTPSLELSHSQSWNYASSDHGSMEGR